MTRPKIFSWKAVFWLPTLCFLAASAVYGLQMRNLLTEVNTNPSDLYCANSVTEGLTQLLNGGAPLSFAGIFGFVGLIRFGVPSTKSIIAISVLNLTCIAVLVKFGISFYRDNLGPPFTLSQVVWWLPTGI